MRKVLLLLAGTAVLCVPAVSVAGDSPSTPLKLTAKRETSHANLTNPGSTCKSQRTASDFAASHNGQTFTEFYGTNRGEGRGTGADGFGNCVSTIANHKTKRAGDHGAESGKEKAKSHRDDSAESGGEDDSKSQDKNGVSPAMACKAMEGNDLTHFQTRYGRRPNAFGRCVSQQAKS